MQTFTWPNILSFLNTGKQDAFFEQGTGISIGSFDGLHKGHRLLLNTLIEECKKSNLLSGVVTFVRPLPSIKHSSDYKGDLTTLNQRLELFEQLGLDFAIIVDFNDEFSSMLGADFLNILVNACNMELIAEGIDFRCGYKGATDSQAIRYFGEKNGVKTIFVDPVYYREGTSEEERVSSSYIRSMILKGFFATAQELLERPYQIDLEAPSVSIPVSQILQALPPTARYHCQNENSTPIRVEITPSTLTIDLPSQKIIF